MIALALNYLLVKIIFTVNNETVGSHGDRKCLNITLTI